MSQFMLLISASALCIISITSGFYEQVSQPEMNDLEARITEMDEAELSFKEIMSLMTTPNKIEDPKIKKRNVDEDPECLALLRDESCNHGYHQEYVNSLLKCGPPLAQSAQYAQELCIQKSMGEYCFDTNHIQNRLNQFFERYCNTSSPSCSTECRDALIISRYALGCCISSIYNKSFIPEMFSYSLWSSCSVETVTQECPLNPVTINPSIPRDPTCNIEDDFSTFIQINSLAVCKQYKIESTISRTSHVEGCSDYLLANGGLNCKANRFGTYCQSIFEEQFSSHFRSVSMKCRRDTSCEDVCRKALHNITNTIGCCFIDYYSTDSSQLGTQEWLSSDFWSTCDVKYPGSCQNRYTDDKTPVATIVSSVLIPTIIAIVSTAMIIAVVVKITRKRSGKRAAQSSPRSSSNTEAALFQDTEHVQKQESARGEPMYEYIQDKPEFELRENVAYGTGKERVMESMPY